MIRYTAVNDFDYVGCGHKHKDKSKAEICRRRLEDGIANTRPYRKTPGVACTIATFKLVPGNVYIRVN